MGARVTLHPCGSRLHTGGYDLAVHTCFLTWKQSNGPRQGTKVRSCRAEARGALTTTVGTWRALGSVRCVCDPPLSPQFFHSPGSCLSSSFKAQLTKSLLRICPRLPRFLALPQKTGYSVSSILRPLCSPTDGFPAESEQALPWMSPNGDYFFFPPKII